MVLKTTTTGVCHVYGTPARVPSNMEDCRQIVNRFVGVGKCLRVGLGLSAETLREREPAYFFHDLAGYVTKKGGTVVPLLTQPGEARMIAARRFGQWFGPQGWFDAGAFQKARGETLGAGLTVLCALLEDPTLEPTPSFTWQIAEMRGVLDMWEASGLCAVQLPSVFRDIRSTVDSGACTIIGQEQLTVAFVERGHLAGMKKNRPDDQYHDLSIGRPAYALEELPTLSAAITAFQERYGKADTRLLVEALHYYVEQQRPGISESDFWPLLETAVQREPTVLRDVLRIGHLDFVGPTRSSLDLEHDWDLLTMPDAIARERVARALQHS